MRETRAREPAGFHLPRRGRGARVKSMFSISP